MTQFSEKPQSPRDLELVTISQDILNNVVASAEPYHKQLGEDRWKLLFGDHTKDSGRTVFYYVGRDNKINGFNEAYPKRELDTDRVNGYNRFIQINEDSSVLVQLTDNCPQGAGDFSGYVVTCSVTIDGEGLHLGTQVPATFYEGKSVVQHPFVNINKDFMEVVKDRGPYYHRSPIIVDENLYPDTKSEKPPIERTVQLIDFTPANEPELIVSVFQINNEPVRLEVKNYINT